MCGRYAITLTPEILRTHFRYLEQPNFPPRYNIAPTQPVPVVILRDGQRHFVLMRWGFVPGFVKDLKDFPLVINIRSETVEEKPSFRAAFIRRRGLMPADGFYEWYREGKTNTPYLLRRPSRAPFAFAALHETWSSPDGSEIDTVALVNTHANGLMAAIHHRSPVVLGEADYDAWLDPAATPKDLRALLKPPPDDFLDLVKIGTAVNKVANDNPEIQAPASDIEAETATKPIADTRGDGRKARAKKSASQGAFDF